MAANFIYRCPNTSFKVQGYIAEEVSDDADTYEAITCLACQRIHLVNPANGKVDLTAHDVADTPQLMNF